MVQWSDQFMSCIILKVDFVVKSSKTGTKTVDIVINATAFSASVRHNEHYLNNICPCIVIKTRVPVVDTMISHTQ